MTYRVVFSPEAEADLDEIEQYLALRLSERNAERYVGRIVAHCVSLAMAPYRGTVREDMYPGLRMTGFERRVTILFRVREDRVIIQGIFYGGQTVDFDR